MAFAIGLVLLLAALPIGYLHWNYTNHFESTDDAYIASRQFAIAPEVSGYITAVPVTDNERVKAASVIGRIDDRTYRAALAQAQALIYQCLVGGAADIESGRLLRGRQLLAHHEHSSVVYD